MLYWVGFIVLVLGSVSILMPISGLLVDVLSYPCWYPIISPLLGINLPPRPTQIANMPYYYCINPAVAVVRFVFRLLSALIVAGAGGYMMLSGKKR